MKSFKGYLLIIGATTFWGVAATIAKFLFNQQIQTLILVQTRITISCLILTSFLLIFKRNLLRVPLKDLYKFALLGIIGTAGSNFTYYFTIEHTNVATAILLQYLAPLLVLACAALAGDEKVNLSKVSAGVVSLIGCYLAIGGWDFRVLNLSKVGLLTGLASAFCWAYTNIVLRRLLKVYNVWPCLSYAFIFASLFWIFINPPWEISSAQYSTETWFTFIGFAIISILIPHSLYFAGVQYLTASRAIITATFEPVVAIISAFIIINELLMPIQIIGAVLVITAIAILQIKQEESKIINVTQ